MPSSHLSETLKSRSYIGLVLSQFLAAFNDQAIHIVAIFYASDLLVRYARIENIDEKAVISLVTSCFIAPFFLFSPLAGVLADKFSKRNIIVFWKVAEVGITGLALFAFLLPHLASFGWAPMPVLAQWSAALLIATVFLMGTHSAFFIPAKYGIMPEILHTAVLSRGNGLLEGSSFIANILGTTFGGFLYGLLKSTFDSSGELVPGREWLIGLALFGLALIGTVASLLIARVPAAAPERKLVWQPWLPLKANLGLLRKSRSLAVAVVGIAFFAFMTLFLRQILFFEGETAKELQTALASLNSAEHVTSLAEGDPVDTEAMVPQASSNQRAEFRIAMLVALVGLGVGVGCYLAGYLSGNKLELGLVPIGAIFLVIATAALAFVAEANWSTIVCLVAIGVAAGLYIVPMYTLLQQRAPKESKGNMVATSNFLNVAGGLLAVVVFYFMTFAVQSVMGLSMDAATAEQHPEMRARYVEELKVQMDIPRLLFFSASVVTAAMLTLLCWQRPDFVVRTLLWLRTRRKVLLPATGLQNVPAFGPVILATNARSEDDMVELLAVTDRMTRYVLFEPYPNNGKQLKLVRKVARRLGMLMAPPGIDTAAEREAALNAAGESLEKDYMFAMPLVDGDRTAQAAAFLRDLLQMTKATVLPVYCLYVPVPGAGNQDHLEEAIFGTPLPPEATPQDIAGAILALDPRGVTTAA